MTLDKRLCSVVGLTALACLVWMIWLGKPAFTLDDAYIYQHAATALIQGQETRFPGASAVSGATSVLYLMLLYVVGALLSVGWAQLLLVVLALLLYVSGIYCLARRHGVSPALAQLLSLAALIASNTLLQFTNGLETGLAMAAVVWSLAQFHGSSPARPWAYLLLGVMPALRPELAVLSLVLLLRALAELRHDRRALLVALAMPALMITAVSVFSVWHGGPFVPSTAQAKQFFFAEGCAPALIKLDLVAFSLYLFCLAMGPIMLGVLGWVRSPLRLVITLFVLAFLYAFFLQLPSGLAQNFQRYLYVLVPLVFLGWSELLSSTSRRVRLIGSLALCIAVLFSAAGLPAEFNRYRHALDGTEQALSVARWVADNVPSSSTVLIHDAGAISMYGASPLVDLVGLKTPWVIEVNRVLRWQACGANSVLSIGTIAKASAAEYLVVLKDWDKGFHMTDSLRFTGWDVSRVDGARGDTPYSVYRIRKLE